MHQPRGVGLIHPRHKPSHAHYTHRNTAQRKQRTHPTAIPERRRLPNPGPELQVLVAA